MELNANDYDSLELKENLERFRKYQRVQKLLNFQLL